MTKKYNLTFWQRLSLIPIWFIWVCRPKSERKIWHHVKKGMENHEHTYTIYNPTIYQGRKIDFWDCGHEGCNMTSPSESVNNRLNQ